jgi:TonB family protein
MRITQLGFEPWIVGYLLNSLWQVPLIFFAAWIAARLARPAGPRMEHRIWVSALLLQVLLPLCHFRLTEVVQQAWNFASWAWRGSIAGGHVEVRLGPVAVVGTPSLRLPPGLLWAFLTAYACALLYFAGRLTWGLRKTAAMQQRAVPVFNSDSAIQKLQHCGARSSSGIDPAQIMISPEISGPVTIGIRQRILLLPPGLIEQISGADLEAVLAHEFAHMLRRDFAKNLLYEILSLPAAYHPLLWFTRSRVAETREIVCDTIAANRLAGREGYAHSLLRLASVLSDRMPARTLHAIGIFDANIFERRIMNLTRKPIEVRGIRFVAIGAVCGVLAIAACASALAFRINVEEPAISQSTTPARLTVKVDDLTVLYKKQPIYPVEAKANHDTINGAVVLAVKINKDGVPVDVDVKQSLRNDYDKSALEAVHEWRWKPYLLNGDPIDVATDVTIVYSIEP